MPNPDGTDDEIVLDTSTSSSPDSDATDEFEFHIDPPAAPAERKIVELKPEVLSDIFQTKPSFFERYEQNQAQIRERLETVYVGLEMILQHIPDEGRDDLYEANKNYTNERDVYAGIINVLIELTPDVTACVEIFGPTYGPVVAQKLPEIKHVFLEDPENGQKNLNDLIQLKALYTEEARLEQEPTEELAAYVGTTYDRLMAHIDFRGLFDALDDEQTRSGGPDVNPYHGIMYEFESDYGIGYVAHFIHHAKQETVSLMDCMRAYSVLEYFVKTNGEFIQDTAAPQPPEDLPDTAQLIEEFARTEKFFEFQQSMSAYLEVPDINRPRRTRLPETYSAIANEYRLSKRQDRNERYPIYPPHFIQAALQYGSEVTKAALQSDMPLPPGVDVLTRPPEVEIEQAAQDLLLATRYTALLPYNPDRPLPYFLYSPSAIIYEGKIRDYLIEYAPDQLIALAQQARHLYEEAGIDISTLKPKEITPEDVEKAIAIMEQINPESELFLRFCSANNARFKPIWDKVRTMRDMQFSPDNYEPYEIVIVGERFAEIKEYLERARYVVSAPMLTLEKSKAWFEQGNIAMTIEADPEGYSTQVTLDEIKERLATNINRGGLPSLAGVTRISFIYHDDATTYARTFTEDDKAVVKWVALNEAMITVIHETFEHVIKNMPMNEIAEWVTLLKIVELEPRMVAEGQIDAVKDLRYITSYVRRIAVNGDSVLALKEDFCETAALFFGSGMDLYTLSQTSPIRFMYMKEWILRRVPDAMKPQILEHIDFTLLYYELQNQKDPNGKFRETLVKDASGHMETHADLFREDNPDGIKAILGGTARRESEIPPDIQIEADIVPTSIVVYLDLYKEVPKDQS